MSLMGYNDRTRAIAESYVTGRKDYCFDLDGNEDAANQPDHFSTYTVDSYSCGQSLLFSQSYSILIKLCR